MPSQPVFTYKIIAISQVWGNIVALNSSNCASVTPQLCGNYRRLYKIGGVIFKQYHINAG